MTYLEYVGRDLVRVVDPTFSTSPYKAIGNAAYGDTPATLLNYYFDTSNFGNIITSYYPSSAGCSHGTSICSRAGTAQLASRVRSWRSS